MTRRDRLVRILENFGGIDGLFSRTVKWELDRLLAKHGLDLLTDDAIEMLTTAVVRDWKRTQRMNRENRKLRADNKRHRDKELRFNSTTCEWDFT